MRRTKFERLVRWVMVPVLAVSLLTQAAPGRVRADDPRAEMEKAMDKQKYIAEQKAKAQNELGRVYWDVEESAAQLQKVEQELSAANAELADVKRQLGTAEAVLAAVEAELAAAQKRFDAKREQLAVRVRAINEEGRVSYLAVLFGASSFSDFLSRFDMLQMVVKKDSELFDQVTAEKQNLEVQQEAAADKRNKLAELKQRSEERSRTIEAKRSERVVVSRSLETRKQTLKSQLDQMEQAEKALHDEIDEIQRRMNRKGGKFAPIAPVALPYLITDPYGMRWHPIYGDRRMHWGTDFNASMGSPVYAAEDGVVISATPNSVFGNLIVIDHGGGIATWYAHNSQYLVKFGDTVKQGQQIAKAGSTGWSTGPHVHFEVHVNGNPVNPMDYLN